MKNFILCLLAFSLFVVIGCQKENVESQSQEVETEILPYGYTLESITQSLHDAKIDTKFLDQQVSRDECNVAWWDTLDPNANPELCEFGLIYPCNQTLVLNGVQQPSLPLGGLFEGLCVWVIQVPFGVNQDVVVLMDDGETCTITLECPDPNEEECCDFNSSWNVESTTIDGEVCCEVTFSVDPACDDTSLFGGFSVDGFCDWYNSGSTSTSRSITLCNCQGPISTISFQGNLISGLEALCDDKFTETYDIVGCK